MKKKLIEWLKRYLPAEVLGTSGAMIAAGLIFLLTKNRILSAYAGTIGENTGFYGLIFIREHFNDLKNSKNEGKKHGVMGFFKTIRKLIVEYSLFRRTLLNRDVVRNFIGALNS